MSLEQFNNGEQNSSVRNKINTNFSKLEPEYGTSFTGEFNFAKYFVSFANYTTAGSITLSSSTTKYNGATNKVLIKGDINITVPTSWSFRGSDFSTDANEWNEIYVQYEQEYITIINTVLDSSYQVVDDTTGGNGGTADNTSPSFISGYPQSTNVAEDSFDIQIQLDEIGTGYLTVVPNGTAAPTSQEVKDGTATGAIASRNVAVTSANTTATMSVTGLSAETAYDVYVVAEDDETTPNLQSAPVKVDVTTAAATGGGGNTVAITSPTEGETITGDATLAWGIEATTVNITSPTEGETITGDVTLTFNIS
jgi:hypothetical protein